MQHAVRVLLFWVAFVSSAFASLNPHPGFEAASNGSYRASVLDGGQRLARPDDYSSAGALLGTVAQFQYDANGDLTQKQAAAGSLALAWDPEGHLATAATTGTGAVSQSYLYDDQGRRIRRTSGATTMHDMRLPKLFARQY
jgi:YD repeat-containing protein